jgi:hypothetical protein
MDMVEINKQAKELCDAGVCVSMAQARRQVMSQTKPERRNMVVWHGSEFLNYFFTEKLTGYFVPVANVLCRTLDDAYTLTNNIDCAWTDNDFVSPAPIPPQGNTTLYRRSTSAGDLIEVDGIFHAVEDCGFRQISEEEVSSLTLKRKN